MVTDKVPDFKIETLFPIRRPIGGFVSAGGLDANESFRLMLSRFYDYHTLQADAQRLLNTLGHA